ncbi:hypothetical protein [Streptomyces sp. NPDC093109]|uniref:hypothetical protein n=1 Tax=Streptomyces sp. NPDC093109 TaxID=3154977 RepID=UPI00344F3CCE
MGGPSAARTAEELTVGIVAYPAAVLGSLKIDRTAFPERSAAARPRSVCFAYAPESPRKRSVRFST